MALSILLPLLPYAWDVLCEALQWQDVLPLLRYIESHSAGLLQPEDGETEEAEPQAQEIEVTASDRKAAETLADQMSALLHQQGASRDVALAALASLGLTFNALKADETGVGATVQV